MKESPIKVWRQNSYRFLNLGKTGKIISFTRINTPPEGFSFHEVAVVELESGQRMVGQIVAESGKVTVGSRVVGVLRRLESPNSQEIVQYLVKFKSFS